ncbi:acyl carrier protein [Nostocoides australiense]|uniref:acyl carrier protein n=1 Tax=Nostocoides australiense TaxID=99480 RepID=UPI00191659F9|nr:acyl carrier protein [Tetrasphaera australiensis]
MTEILVDQMGMSAEQVVPEADLRSDLGLDSLDTLELLTVLEEQMGISISEEVVRQWTTVQDVLDFAAATPAPAGSGSA